MKSAPSLLPALRLVLEMAPETPPQLDKDNVMTYPEITYQTIWSFKLNLEARIMERDCSYNSCELFSETNFKELSLHPTLISGLNTMKISFPTKIQNEILSQFVDDMPKSSVIAVSPSGSGKTLALIMTALKVVDPSSCCMQVFLICPHFELATYVFTTACYLSQFCCPKISLRLLGKIDDSPEINDHIIVGTLDSFSSEWASVAPAFGTLKLCAIDDFHAVVGSDRLFGKVAGILINLKGVATLLTANFLEEVPSSFSPSPKIIRLQNKSLCMKSVNQYYVHCGTLEEKFSYLATVCNVFRSLKLQIVIFCNTLETVRWLAKRMLEKWGVVTVLSSDLSECQRIFVLNQFYKGEDRVLISTDRRSCCIRCQGDVGIINFDIPVSLDQRAGFEKYLERIFRIPYLRTSGTVVNLIGGTTSFQILSLINEEYSISMEDLSCIT